MKTHQLLIYLTTASIALGLLICISASTQPMQIERFLTGLFMMVVATWVRVLATELKDQPGSEGG